MNSKTKNVTVNMLHVPGAPGRDAVVQYFSSTPGVDLAVHSDPYRRGVMWNWTQAMAYIVRNKEHERQPWTIMLQDDVVPAADDWLEQLQEATENSPSPLLGLFHLGGLGERTAAKGAAYALGSDVLWGPAYAIRSDILEDMARWCITVSQRTGYPHDDRLMCAFMLKQQQRIAVTARSFFTLKTVPSLMGHTAHVQPRPTLTIADAGPAWNPRSTASAGRSTPPEITTLAKESL